MKHNFFSLIIVITCNDVVVDIHLDPGIINIITDNITGLANNIHSSLDYISACGNTGGITHIPNITCTSGADGLSNLYNCKNVVKEDIVEKGIESYIKGNPRPKLSEMSLVMQELNMIAHNACYTIGSGLSYTWDAIGFNTNFIVNMLPEVTLTDERPEITGHPGDVRAVDNRLPWATIVFNSLDPDTFADIDCSFLYAPRELGWNIIIQAVNPNLHTDYFLEIRDVENNLDSVEESRGYLYYHLRVLDWTLPADPTLLQSRLSEANILYRASRILDCVSLAFDPDYIPVGQALNPQIPITHDTHTIVPLLDLSTINLEELFPGYLDEANIPDSSDSQD